MSNITPPTVSATDEIISFLMMQSSTLKRPGSSPDPPCAKALRSSLILQPKVGSPLLMLSPEEGGFRVYSPEEDRVYETKRDFSGYRFLGNSGKWFLVVDSGSNLYIIDVFSDERIHLPPIESIQGGVLKVKRSGDNRFSAIYTNESIFSSGIQGTVDDLRGLLWVDDKCGDYVVVWQFDENEYLGYCKKGDDHYREIQTRVDVRRELRGLSDMALKGYNLYLFATRSFIRRLDLSGKDGFKDVSENHRHPMWTPNETRDEIERMRAMKVITCTRNIAVTTLGEVLYVECTDFIEVDSTRRMMFRVYKRDAKDLDPNTYDTRLVELDSLGDEALFLDLGITVPADHTLGIEPNSIYFTRGDRIRQKKRSYLHICVYNLATKTIKDFPSLSSLNLKDAYWFLPS